MNGHSARSDESNNLFQKKKLKFLIPLDNKLKILKFLQANLQVFVTLYPILHPVPSACTLAPITCKKINKLIRSGWIQLMIHKLQL